MDKLRHLTGRMQYHIGVADRLDLASVQLRRIAALVGDDMQATAILRRLVRQHLHHKRVGAGLITLDDPARRLVIDDPVLQPTPARGRQGPDAMPDAVQIERQPAIAMRQPVLDGGAKSLRKHRGETAGGYRENHRIAVNDRAEIEAA